MVKPCLLCNGNQVLLNPSSRKEVLCPACDGQGRVDPLFICACGRPAMIKKDDIRYCGRSDCFRDIENNLRYSVPTIPYGWYN